MRNRNNKFKNIINIALFLGVFTCSGVAGAGVIGGLFSSDNFGYTGTVTKYDTLEDAQNGINVSEIINIGQRDASFYFVDNASDYGTDFNILMGSWWYSINGSAGNGNTSGNTGIGFMQIYDDNGNTDTDIDMSFSNFDGTFWRDYTLMVSGGGATAADDSARFSVYNNVNDAGTYLNYNLNITATGLKGVQTGNVIEANNHATGVTGTFDGLFQFGGDSDGDIFTGYYAIDLAFNMNNWAYANNGNLNGPYHDNGEIYASQYVAIHEVPEPSTLAIFALSMIGLISRRLKK